MGLDVYAGPLCRYYNGIDSPSCPGRPMRRTSWDEIHPCRLPMTCFRKSSNGVMGCAFASASTSLGAGLGRRPDAALLPRQARAARVRRAALPGELCQLAGKGAPVCWSPDDYMTVVSLDALTPPAHDDLTAPLWADVAAVRHRGRPRRE